MTGPITAPKLPESAYLSCVHCGLCQQACPTYVETGLEAESPRGRIHLMRALAEASIRPEPQVLRHLDHCLGCRACETACPSGVEYGRLIEAARPYVEAHLPRSRAEGNRRARLARWLPNRRRLAQVAPALRALSRSPLPKLASLRALPLSWRRSLALIPPVERRVALPPVIEARGEAIGSVGFLAGCVTQAWFSETNARMAHLLALAGWRVVLPSGQECCGALAGHLGRREEAERLARRNVFAFGAARVDRIVATAAGCGAWLRDWGEHAGERGRHGGDRLAPLVRDATELLAEAELPLTASPIAARVAYQDPCHLEHGQGVHAAPRQLLARIPGVELVELADAMLCCGSAGTYNLTEPDRAWALAERKADAVEASGATILATANPGCLVQIQAALRLRGSRIRVAHVLDLVAEACALEVPKS